MKKAKLLLAAITLLAVVGGTLAFRAKHFGHTLTLFAYTSSATTDPNRGDCGCLDPMTINNAKTTVPPAGVVVAASTTTVITCDPSACTTRTTIAADE